MNYDISQGEDESQIENSFKFGPGIQVYKAGHSIAPDEIEFHHPLNPNEE